MEKLLIILRKPETGTENPLTFMVVKELQSLEWVSFLIEVGEKLTGIKTLPGFAH